MSSVSKKKVTVKSDIWLLDGTVLTAVGFQESPLFGTESTQFYWRAERNNKFYSLYLYLAACKEKKIQVNFKLLYRQKNTPISERSFGMKGEMSLDKSKKIGCDEWSKLSLSLSLSYNTSTEITFEEAEVATTKVTQQKHYEALSSQLLTLRLNSRSSDITLVTTLDGRKFSAHKVILASRSAVFAAMFQHVDLVENKTNRVEIDDVTGEVMDALLRYIYSADVQGIEIIAEHLLPAADKYDIPLLVQACVESLQSNVSVENALRFFILADLHHLEVFKQETVKFIQPNLAAIRESADWKKCINLELLQQLFDLLLLIPRK